MRVKHILNVAFSLYCKDLNFLNTISNLIITVHVKRVLIQKLVNKYTNSLEVTHSYLKI